MTHQFVDQTILCLLMEELAEGIKNQKQERCMDQTVITFQRVNIIAETDKILVKMMIIICKENSKIEKDQLGNNHSKFQSRVQK